MPKSDFPAITSHLSGIGLAQRDDPHDLAPHREDQNVQASVDQTVSLPANLAIRTALIGNHRRRVEIHLFRIRQRDTVLIPVALILVRVELDLHD
jgi:hypothetical protein